MPPKKIAKPAKPQAPSYDRELVKDITTLTKEVKRMQSMDVFRAFKNPWKFMGLSFLKGLMIGFGSVLGASVLVAIFLYLIAQIQLVPILGDFVKDVIDEVQIEELLTS